VTLWPRGMLGPGVGLALALAYPVAVWFVLV
jgi:hypothetical protein